MLYPRKGIRIYVGMYVWKKKTVAILAFLLQRGVVPVVVNARSTTRHDIHLQFIMLILN
jgi:hypothetical protein